MPHGAYVELIEYGKDAYLPISEIASGWIKNIHEFIKEGQRDVGKVISVDNSRGSIDVSLKKATSREKEDKLSEYGLEKRYEKLFEQAAALSGIKEKTGIEALKEEIAKRMPTYTELINGTAQDEKYASFIKNKKFPAALSEIIQKNIKPKRYIVSYLMTLRSDNPKTGISAIRDVLASVEKIGLEVLYLGAPRYRITSEGSSYLAAEDKVKEARNMLEGYSGKLAFEMKSEKKD